MVIELHREAGQDGPHHLILVITHTSAWSCFLRYYWLPWFVVCFINGFYNKTFTEEVSYLLHDDSIWMFLLFCSNNAAIANNTERCQFTYNNNQNCCCLTQCLVAQCWNHITTLIWDNFFRMMCCVDWQRSVFWTQWAVSCLITLSASISTWSLLPWGALRKQRYLSR